MTATEVEREGLVAQMSAKIGLLLEVGNRQAAATEKMSRRLDAALTMQPVYFRAVGSCTVDTAGFGVIEFSPNGPDQGHVWEIENVVAGGATFATSVGGSPEFYASATDLRALGDGSPPIVDLIDATTVSLPAISFYSRGQFVLRSSEKLYVRIVAGTVGARYSAVARGIDFQEGAHRQVTGL